MADPKCGESRQAGGRTFAVEDLLKADSKIPVTETKDKNSQTRRPD